MRSKICILLLVILSITELNYAQTDKTLSSELYQWLKSLPDIEVTSIKSDNIFSEAY